jgi:sugar lactone lactonase YvrE|nr:PQQ-binding-like beta-propeller repeat protein [Kofleriaceae bacterium]
MRRAVILAALVAAVGCGSGSGGATATTPRGSSREPSQPLAPNPQLDAARAAWLAGDLAGARGLLVATGDDPRAVALLARLDALAGRGSDVTADVARLGELGVAIAPEIARDAPSADRANLSRDGAWLLAFHLQANGAPRVTAWDVVAGRDAFTVDASNAMVVAGTTHAAVLVAQIADTQLAAYDLPSGHLLWTRSDEVTRTHVRDFVAGVRGRVTIADDRNQLVDLDVDSGAPVRTVRVSWTTASLRISGDGATVLDANALYAIEGDGRAIAQLDTLVAPDGGYISSWDLAPDGHAWAYTTSAGHMMERGRDANVLAELETGGAGDQVQFARDGSLFVLTARRVRHFDPAGKLVGDVTLPAELQPVMPGPTFLLGGDGQLIARVAGQLAVVELATPQPVVVSRLGGATRAGGIAWSPDGKALAVTADDSATATVWTVATGATRLEARATADDTPLDLMWQRNRVFVYDGARPVRYVEVPDPVRWASRGGHALVVSTGDSALAVFDADTSAAAGTIDAGAGGVDRVAVRPDGQLVAVSLVRGGVEIWDLRARARLVTIAAGGGALAAVAADGRYDAGAPHAVTWFAADVALPSAPGAGTPNLVTAVLSARPPAVAIAAQPQAPQPPRGCLPDDETPRAASYAALTDTAFTYCLRANDDPYCFAVDLASHKTTPASAPVAALAPVLPGTDPTKYPDIEAGSDDHDVKICTSATACRDVHVATGDTSNVAVTDDAALLAIDTAPRNADVAHAVDIYDLATSKLVARFPIRYLTADGKPGYEASIAFVGHTLLAIVMTCAATCGYGTMYDLHGRRIGGLATEASSVTAWPFHDDYYVLRDDADGSFVVQSLTTGKVLVKDKRAGWVAAITRSRVARAIGTGYAGQGGAAVIDDAAGHVVAELPLLRCTNRGQP